MTIPLFNTHYTSKKIYISACLIKAIETLGCALLNYTSYTTYSVQHNSNHLMGILQ